MLSWFGPPAGFSEEGLVILIQEDFRAAGFFTFEIPQSGFRWWRPEFGIEFCKARHFNVTVEWRFIRREKFAVKVFSRGWFCEKFVLRVKVTVLWSILQSSLVSCSKLRIVTSTLLRSGYLLVVNGGHSHLSSWPHVKSSIIQSFLPGLTAYIHKGES